MRVNNNEISRRDDGIGTKTRQPIVRYDNARWDIPERLVEPSNSNL